MARMVTDLDEKQYVPMLPYVRKGPGQHQLTHDDCCQESMHATCLQASGCLLLLLFEASSFNYHFCPDHARPSVSPICKHLCSEIRHLQVHLFDSGCNGFAEHVHAAGGQIQKEFFSYSRFGSIECKECKSNGILKEFFAWVGIFRYDEQLPYSF